MDIRYKLYSYPILSSLYDDYYNCEFTANISVVKDICDILIQMDIKMDNDEINNLIIKNKVEYVFHIECSQTSYRAIIKTTELKNIKRIAETKLNGKVSICSFIIAKEDIENYKNSQFNDDYAGMTFNVGKGSILGIGNQVDIEITKELNEMTKIPSVFSILRMATEHNEGMVIDINSDRIKIWLNDEDFTDYKDLLKRLKYKEIVNTMIIMPALLYALDILKYSETDEYESYRWFKSIDNKLKASSLSLSNEVLQEKPTFELAQKLLDLPIRRALNTLSDEYNECADGEEDY